MAPITPRSPRHEASEEEESKAQELQTTVTEEKSEAQLSPNQGASEQESAFLEVRTFTAHEAAEEALKEDTEKALLVHDECLRWGFIRLREAKNSLDEFDPNSYVPKPRDIVKVCDATYR